MKGYPLCTDLAPLASSVLGLDISEKNTRSTRPAPIRAKNYGVADGVLVGVGVLVSVGVRVDVAVRLGVIVRDGVGVKEGVAVGMAVGASP